MPKIKIIFKVSIVKLKPFSKKFQNFPKIFKDRENCTKLAPESKM